MADLTPVIPAGEAGSEWIVRGGKTRAFLLALDLKGNVSNSTHIVSQLWQITDRLGAPTGPAITNLVALGQGRGLCQAIHQIPTVRSTTPFLLRWRVIGSTNVAVSRLIAVPNNPLRELANLLTNRPIALSGSAESLAGWFESHGLVVKRSLQEGARSPLPLVAVAGPVADEQIEESLVRVKHLAAAGTPVIWFGNTRQPGTAQAPSVQWHHLAGSAPVVFVPAAWQSRLAESFVIEYQFAEILHASLETNSIAWLMTTVNP